MNLLYACVISRSQYIWHPNNPIHETQIVQAVRVERRRNSSSITDGDGGTPWPRMKRPRHEADLPIPSTEFKTEWNYTSTISKEMYQLDATIYYDFILINSLYMFRTFTCPSSGVIIYRLFTAACGVMP